MTPLPSPPHPVLRYFGGKWVLADWIISHFPRHMRYVELYGGAFNVGIKKKPAQVTVYNDLSRDVINLFSVLRDEEKSERLIRYIELTPYSRAEYDLAWVHDPGLDEVEQARRYIIRSMMSYSSKGSISPNKTGFRSYTNDPTGANPVRVWSRYPDSLRMVCERLRDIQIECVPALECIRKYDGPDTLFYADPPYLHETRQSFKDGGKYRYEMTEADHIALAEALRACEGRVVVSHYPCDLYMNLYQGWRYEEKTVQLQRTDGATEAIWIKPAPADSGKPLTLF